MDLLVKIRRLRFRDGLSISALDDGRPLLGCLSIDLIWAS